MSAYGRYQVPETPRSLLDLHVHDGRALAEVDHEPRVGVLDQQRLTAQGIYTDKLIPGARRVDALGSCTANADTAALSNALDAGAFYEATRGAPLPAGDVDVYGDVVAAEKFAIRFYHVCTNQTGDPSQEWPPTDCGSSGPYVVSEDVRLGYCTGQRIAHGADNIVSLMQDGGLLMGSPWLYAWEEPGPDGFVDGDGSPETLAAQTRQGVAGGHETFLSAVEKLVLTDTGHVDPRRTVVRDRNSWSRSWGDGGSCRFHLSTIVALGAYVDLRQLMR